MSTRAGEFALETRIKVSFWWHGNFVPVRTKYFHGESAHHFSGLEDVSRTREFSFDFQVRKVLKARRPLVVRDVSRKTLIDGAGAVSAGWD